MISLNNKRVELKTLMPVIKEYLQSEKDVIFMPNGISMLPMLHQGKDKVVISSIQGKLKKYDLSLYQRDNGEYVMHRVIRVGETYTCCGDHQYVPEEGLTQEQMIAIVTSFTHKGKMVSVENIWYKFYCRYWCFSRPFRYLLYRIKCKFKMIIKKFFLRRQ